MVSSIYGNSRARLVPTVDQRAPLGTRMILPDGRVFRYARAGSPALTIGVLAQNAVGGADHIKDLAVAAAAAIGATSITITNGATTAITANMFKEGYVFMNDAAGAGQMAVIKSHPAAAINVACVLTLEDEDALTVALTTASQVGLRKNAYDGILVSPTTPTGLAIGVTPVAVTAAYYFWLQTWGPAAVLGNGTLVAYRAVSRGLTTAGTVDTYPITLTEGVPNTYVPGDSPVVGRVMQLAATTEYSLIFLELAP